MTAPMLTKQIKWHAVIVRLIMEIYKLHIRVARSFAHNPRMDGWQSVGHITPNSWPPNSPDLNPLDYCVWSIIEKKVDKHPHNTKDSLKAAIV